MSPLQVQKSISVSVCPRFRPVSDEKEKGRKLERKENEREGKRMDQRLDCVRKGIRESEHETVDL